MHVDLGLNKETVKLLIAFVTLMILSACVSKLNTKGVSLSEQELEGVMEAFQRDCNCGDSKPTLLLSCPEKNNVIEKGTCFEVYTDGNHPSLNQPSTKPLHCSIRKTNERYHGTRTAIDDGLEIIVVSGCGR